MAYTNSSLVNYTKISPNKNSPRNHAIDTITIHCVVGQASVETLGDIFTPTSRQASSNYGIGSDGRIGMYVEEKDRSWCSSSPSNDHRAITIEVASDTSHPYAVNDKAMNSLTKLLVDICKRNNIKELKWKGDKSLIGQVDKQNMTVHRWFTNTECPGDFLYSRLGEIAAEVNKQLKPAETYWYRVRKAWDDPKSQLGAYEVLENAKKTADENKGYFVFNPEGETIYPIVCEKVSVSLPQLVKDCTGEAGAVKSLQQLLIAKGFTCGSTGADGEFGENTEKAVRSFQSKNGLAVDGICGVKTWLKLLGG